MGKTLSVLFVSGVCACFALGQTQSSGDSQILDSQLLAACRANNTSLLDSLVKGNRLGVKPSVERLLTQAIKSDPTGRSKAFRVDIETAGKISTGFRRIHGEKNLVLAVEYVRSWSAKERHLKLVADSLFALGTQLRAKNETRDQALQLYQTCLGLYRKLNDQRGEGSALGSLGFIYWYKNDPDRALRYFEDGLKARSAVDDRQLTANSYNDIGSVYYNFFKNYSKAIEYHRRAQQLRREIGDKGGLGRALDNLALDVWDSGDLKEAQQYCEAAARAHAEAGDQDRVARSVYNSGLLLTELEKYSDALLAFDRALSIREKLGDDRKIAEMFDARGVVYLRMGDDEAAYGSFQKALSMMEETGDERGVAAASYKTGVVLGSLGRTDAALQAYQKSLDIFQRIDDKKGLLETLSNIGVAYFDMKQYPKSEELHRKALAMSREVHDYITEINNLIMLGNAQNFQAMYDSARENYLGALEKATRGNNVDLIWPALLGLGDIEEKRHAYDSALSYYSQALECIEGIRGSLASEQFKISFADKRRFVYEAILHLLTTLHIRYPSAGYDARAFRVAEGAKARAFLDLLTESLAKINGGADSLLMGRHDSLVAAMNAARQQLEILARDPHNKKEAIVSRTRDIEDLDREVRRVWSELRAKNPRYSELRTPDPIGADDVQKMLLDPQTVLLEYSLGDSSSSLWVITQRERQLFPLPNRESLKNQIDVLRFTLADQGGGSYTSFLAVARRLYQTLVEPAEQYLENGTRLLVVPDGELSYVPFEVLLTDNDRGEYADLPYLVKRHPIAYVQSATVMRSLREQRKGGNQVPGKDLIAFGDPMYATGDSSSERTVSRLGVATADSLRGTLARLPHTGVEVQGIAKLFPAGMADIYLRDSASEDRAKQRGLLANYRFIHFAAHGLVNERRPDLSAIALSNNKEAKEDGLLQCSEIFNLRISAQLVVLSACQTGLGRMARGEGLIGLTRAFMYAGAPAVVVSLWNVADESTATLMQKFYEGMVVRREDKSEALRHAKLMLCESSKYSHPFYWAPFVIIGDWESGK